jgi:hypothetical protein
MIRTWAPDDLWEIAEPLIPVPFGNSVMAREVRFWWCGAWVDLGRVPGRLGQEDLACGFSPVDTFGTARVHVPFLIGIRDPAGVHILGVITYAAGAAGRHLMMDLEG